MGLALARVPRYRDMQPGSILHRLRSNRHNETLGHRLVADMIPVKDIEEKSKGIARLKNLPGTFPLFLLFAGGFQKNRRGCIQYRFFTT